jgi:hypothetical protein
LQGVLEKLEGGWFDGAVQSDPLCATPRTTSVTCYAQRPWAAAAAPNVALRFKKSGPLKELLPTVCMGRRIGINPACAFIGCLLPNSTTFPFKFCKPNFLVSFSVLS